jgi:hypothetical protein
MQWERDADSLYPMDSQPGFRRNLFDYVMGDAKMQGDLSWKGGLTAFLRLCYYVSM